MNDLIFFTRSEKKLATEASNAADELLDLWSFINQGRVVPRDLKDAQKHIACLIEFGNLIQQKLSPEAVKMANPSEQTGYADCSNADRPVEKFFGCKGLRGLIHRFLG